MEYFIVLLLISLSAMFSGLTLGFFSLSKDDLERKKNLGDPMAIKVFSVRKDGNLLLCTLLMGNVSVNSILSIFLGSIVSGVVAAVISTVLIVVFGEIVPQAVFSRYALLFGSRLSWLVRIFIFIFYPFTKPLSSALNKILGDEIPTYYSRKELVKIIEEHEDSSNSDIDADEERILKGALSFSEKTVEDIMTPRSAVFSLPVDTKLNNDVVKKIVESGHSRIPIYKDKLENIVGILYVKDLVSLDGDWRRIMVGSIARPNVIHVDYNKRLDDLLNAFKKTRNHLFVVLDEFGLVIGVVSVEDVIEEIIGSEIVDEYDRYEDMQKVALSKLEKRNINKV